MRATVVTAAGFKAGQSKAGGLGWQDEIAATLSAQCSGVEPTVCVKTYDARGNGDGQTVSTITGDHESRITDYTSLICSSHPTYCLQGNGIDRADTAGCNGKGWTEDTCYTLNTIDRPAVVYFQGCAYVDTTHADDVVRMDDVVAPLQARDYKGGKLVFEKYAVRRLTPLECERLQGFPDGWTDIGEWTDEKGKRHPESSDAARYKALGNSIAIPPWKFVIKRLCSHYERDATMASLLDGIGGFPYIWEQLNGKGSCLWASEIEQFPIAVTKRRFGEE